MITQTPVNIIREVAAMAERFPDRPAIYYPSGHDGQGQTTYTHYTFTELLQASREIAGGLHAYGITRGMRTVLMVTPSLEFFALMYALLGTGIVPVLIDPGMGLANLKVCLKEAEPTAFIGVPKAHAARLVMGWGKDTLKHFVTVGTPKLWGGTTLAKIRAEGQRNPAELADTHGEEMAALLFTSGSTGVPKGVVYQHRNFVGQIELLRRNFDFEAGTTDLPTFPPFALFDPALGVTAVIPEMDATKPAQADPRKLIAAIEKFGVESMFGSPALLNTFSRYGEKHGIYLPTLKRVLSAGAPVPAAIQARMAKLLPPDAKIYTPYGATECLPVCKISHHEILGETRAHTEAGGGVCIGQPVAGTEVAIIGISDDPIPTWSDDLRVPPGEIGEIVVKGPTTTVAYYNRPGSTELAKIYEADGSVRHRMGDLGYQDAQGRIWFCGRKGHRVVTPEGTLYTIPCEAVFNTHPDVYRSALVGVESQGETLPVLCVELEPESKGRNPAALKLELLNLGQQFAHTRSIRHMLVHPALPVDIRHNSKIFREKLAPWARKELKL
jgi:acyl-CoA synthetase (AMP-forming)/AMP-acid ligase II